MHQIKIVTDSAAYLTPADVSTYQITVMNSPILIGDKVFGYINKVSHQKLHQLFNDSSSTPTIGEVSVADLTQVYNKLGADGSQILSIHLSDRLSNTYHNAVIAAEKSASQVEVVNSQVTAAGLRYQVMAAAKAASAGDQLLHVLEIIDQIKLKTRIFFAVPSNVQLINRRLIGRIRGKIEKRLKVSYIMTFKDNDFNFVTKSRQEDLMATFWERQLPVMHNERIVQLSILHAGDSKRADFLYEMLNQEFPFVPIRKIPTNPEMACFIGANSTGVTYLLD